MDRATLTWLSALIAAACIGLDLWFATARCSVSPPLYSAGIAIGGLVQVLAAALPMLVARHFPTESLKFQLRGVGIGLFLAVISVPMLQASLLYGDGIDKDGSYRSIGIECHGPALRSGYGTNKSLERTPARLIKEHVWQS